MILLTDFSPFISLSLSHFFLPCFPLFAAIFVSGQLISRRRRGAITETLLTGPGRLTEAASTRRPDRQFEVPFGSIRQRKGESSRDSPRGISDVAIGAGHESFMRQSFLVPGLHVFLFPLSSFSFRALKLPFVAAPRKSLRADASSYQSAESVNRRDNVFQPVPLPQRFSPSISYSSHIHSVSPLLLRVDFFANACLWWTARRTSHVRRRIEV